MNKWWWLLLIVLLWAAVGFAIFGLRREQKPIGAPLPSKVERIVSTAPSLTEILYALGLSDRIVAVSNDSDYPPEATKKKKVGTFWYPSIEAVIAAEPDLVVTLGIEQQKNLAERLRQMGYNCLTLHIEKISDLFEAIEIIGAATGRQTEAKSLVSDIRDRLNDLSSLAVGREKVKVLWVVQREPLRVAGRDTFVNEMIELAGGENAIGPTLHKYPPIGAEQVIASAADVIIEPAMGQQNLAEQQNSAVRHWNKFSNLPAARHGQIYVIDADTICRLGPRISQGAKSVAICLRPDLLAK